MSLGEADAKFPNQSSGALPPSPSRENPGQVYPKSDPKAAPSESIPGTGGEQEPASLTGNPYVLKNALGKLDHALTEVISVLEGEEKRVGSSAREETMLGTIKGWRAQLDRLQTQGTQRTGSRHSGDTAEEGGLFTD